MSGRALFYLLITHAFCIAVISAQNCDNDSTTPECKFLRDNIVQYLDGDPCENFYSYTCGNEIVETETLLNKPKHLPNLLEIEKDLLDFLERPEYSEIVGPEKDLYVQCLKLGTKEHNDYRNQYNYANYYSLFTLHRHVKNNSTWQYIDKEVSDLGFGHAFFNVKLVQDPDDLKKNIIMLEPPPITVLNSTHQFLKAVFNDNTIGIYNVYRSVEDYKHLYTYVKKHLQEPIDQFFESWIEAIDEVSQLKYLQFPNNKTVLKDWNEIYNIRYYASDATKILWEDILTSMFREAGVYIDNDEQIIVKNVEYFSKLFYLLARTPNDVTGIAVILRAVTEHLKYVDWNFAQQLLTNKDDKISFCSKETKLYGPSYKMIFDLKKRQYSDKTSNERILEIVRNVDKAMRGEIYRTSLSHKVKFYLLAELDKITINLLQDTWNTESISNIYGQYQIRNNYLDSIISYRTMLRNNEFSLLRDQSQVLSRMPFSATDLSVPANRFIMYVLSLTRTLDRALSDQNKKDSSFLREYFYGNYGVKLSVFLYGLMNENKFEDPYRYQDLLTDAHPEFSFTTLQGLITKFGEFKRLFGTAAITQAYGLKIAYQAMHYAYLGNDYVIKNISFMEKNITSVDQFFFLIYSRSVCAYQHPRVVNTAVANIDSFIYEFDCHSVHYYDKLQGLKKPFEEPNNRIYLIQLDKLDVNY